MWSRFVRYGVLLAGLWPATLMASDLVGSWTGIAEDGSGWSMRVKIDVSPEADSSVPDQAYKASFSSADLAAGDIPVASFVYKDQAVSMTVLPNWVSFDGRYDPAQKDITGTLTMWGEALPITLKQDNPALSVFDSPRVDKNGKATTHYKFEKPNTRRDDWKTAHAKTVGVDPKQLTALGQAMTNGDYPTANAVLIARHGKLIFEEYFYGSDTDRLQTIQSATKSVTSLLVGAAIDRRLIKNVNVPVWTLFPDRSDNAWVRKQYPITLHDALAMSAGLAWSTDAPIGPDNSDYLMNISADMLGFILDRPMAEAPGQHFLYNSGLSILVGEAVHEASGMATDVFANDVLFKPLGITRYKWLKTPDGIAHGGGGLYLRARDALKIGQMVLDHGKWKDHRVLSADWIARSTASQAPENGKLDHYRKTWKDRWGYPDVAYQYGYQWWRFPFQVDDRIVYGVTAWGNAEQILVIFPEFDLVVLMLSSDLSNRATRRFERINKYILPALRDQKSVVRKVGS